MQVTPIQFDVLSMITGPADSAGSGLPPRSAGLHLSQVYWDLEKSYQDSVKSGKYADDFTPEEMAHYQAGGFLWERVYSQVMADSFRTGDIVRPGEFLVDGIVGSPDNLRISPEARVVETKATWRSSNKLDKMEKNFWLWLVQMKGYCKIVGVQEAELYVFFVNGNYAPPVPQTKAYLFKWSQFEIEENWGMIKSHARRRGWV